MPKFRYLITETFNGQVVGTNERSVAENFASSEDCFVVDAVECKWLVIRPGESDDITIDDIAIEAAADTDD